MITKLGIILFIYFGALFFLYYFRAARIAKAYWNGGPRSLSLTHPDTYYSKEDLEYIEICGEEGFNISKGIEETMKKEGRWPPKRRRPTRRVRVTRHVTRSMTDANWPGRRNDGNK